MRSVIDRLYTKLRLLHWRLVRKSRPKIEVRQPDSSDLKAYVVVNEFARTTRELLSGLWANEVKRKEPFFSSLSAESLKSIMLTRHIEGLWESASYPQTQMELEWERHFVETTLAFAREYEVLYGPINAALALPSELTTFGIRINGVLVSPAQIKAMYYARQIRMIHGTVLEIGGGLGLVGYYLSKISPVVKYINVDIPETLLFAKYIHAVGDTKATMLDPFHIELIPHNSVDYVINTRSLSEMPKEVIDHYFKEIDRVLKPGGYFLSDNSNKPRHEYEIAADKFPVPPHFKLLSKTKSIWFTRMLGDRFIEELYQKN